MIEIRYVSSDGQEYNLIGDKMRATNGTFHKYEWKASVVAQVYGDSVYGFEKESIIYTPTLSFRGTLEERKEFLDRLIKSFEYDVVHLTPGKIYFGDYYINCYITSSDTATSSIKPTWSDAKIEIYCPYPFWIKEITKEFYKYSGGGSAGNYLDYPYDFKYDFTSPPFGVEHWKVEHYTSSNFKMIVYGRCANPRIVINNHVYQVYDTLENGEYMIIDSHAKSVKKYLSNGTVQNIFGKRDKVSSVFDLIPPNELTINWNGEFGFDIILYLERSEPQWI